MRTQRAVAALAAALTLAATAATAWFIYETPGSVFDGAEAQRIEPLPTGGEPVLITIKSGESARDIGQRLEDAEIIRSRRLFEVLVGLTGVQDSLEAGDYEFERGLPAIEAVRRIAEGRTASRQITIPEGFRREQIAETLERNGIAEAQAFLDALDATQYREPFLAQLGGSDLEGFLFPARYEFNRDTDAGQVVATMLRGFQDNVYADLQLEGQELTLRDVVTLASIVEREAATAAERPLIAGVFLNRLRLGIPLQADPTVQYALAADAASVEQFGWWKRELTFDDLTVDSPYNTYVHAGLPPGPIANPGAAAIEAVVRPERTNYLFFVARDDGTHVFAETLEEHLKNVERYRPQ